MIETLLRVVARVVDRLDDDGTHHAAVVVLVVVVVHSTVVVVTMSLQWSSRWL
jgi:hypothetical protein